jgi:hypothetical protein
MLLFGARTYTIEGISIFPDHADPNQFWYLPGPVQLSRRRADGRADLTFIKFRPAAAGAAKGGGFLMFSVNLRLDPIVERRILSQLSSAVRGRPKLAVAPFDEGTVKVVALDFQSGGDGAQPAAAPPGAIRAVEKALGATVPSLHGENTAAFALTLSQEGAIIVEKALQQGTTPVGVVYDLKFTAMRPALNVKITADMKRVYDQFSMGAQGQYLFISGGIEAGFEKLVQDGSIKIEVVDFIGAADRESKEKWALDFFKDTLLAKYFEPSLTPGSIVGGFPKPEGLAEVIARGQQLRPPQPAAPAKPTPADAEKTPPDPAESPTVGTGVQPKGGDGGVAEPAAQADGDASPTTGTGGPPAPATSADIGSAAAAGLAPAVIGGGRAVRVSGADGALAAATGPGDGAGKAAADKATPVISFKFRGIRQEERKTITLEYNRSEAMQRSYAPQGFVGLLAADLDLRGGGHFVDVDLDDPFFREFEVTASAPIDFARIGLNAAEVALSYGRASDPGGPKVRDFRFSTADKADKSWKVFTNAAGDARYRESTQYHFDALSGWDGARTSYEVGPTETADRSLLLNPFEHLGFIEAQVVANRIDWGIVDRVDVALRYDDGNGWKPTKTVSLKSDAPRQEWKIRTTNQTRRSFEYKVTFHFTDRTTRIQDWRVSDTPSVVIDDLFPGGLDFQIVPILDASRTKMAFVDISYEDAANNYKRQTRIKVAPQDGDKSFRLALMNPNKRDFRYRVTVVPNSGRMQTGALEASEETLIGIND